MKCPMMALTVLLSAAASSVLASGIDRVDLVRHRLAADRVRDSRIVDLGSPDWETQKSLRKGWSIRERGWGTSFAWATGRRAELVFFSVDGEATTLRFRARSAPTITGAQVVRIRANGHSVGQATLADGWTEHAFELPARTVRR